MAASDFFENFLLHDGVKSLHPNENLSIVPLVSSRDDTTGGYSASGRQPLVGPWCDVRPSRRWGVPRPATCQASTIRERAAPCPETARSMHIIFPAPVPPKWLS